tara:strand:- start:212 stop:442 length:231 start_codon:yes stop_codon:yes gene_type:complete
MAKRQLAEFKNVGLLKETHDKLREISDYEQRTFTRQLKIILDKYYDIWRLDNGLGRDVFAKDHVHHNSDLSDPEIE